MAKITNKKKKVSYRRTNHKKMQQEIEIVWLQQKDGDWTNHKETHSESMASTKLKNVGSEATCLPADHPL